MPRTHDRSAVQRSATLEKGARRGELDAVRFLMHDPRGRAFVARLLELTGCERLTPFQPNAMTLAHDVGVRNLGLWLLEEVRAACPDQELVMRGEMQAREARAQMTQEAEDGNDEHAG